MDLSLLEGALASKSYNKIADICDELMLQAASQGVFLQEEWPYATHLLGHIFVNDINSAQFLWKSIPSKIKETHPEIMQVWKICQRLWLRKYAGVYEEICGFDWTAEAVGLVMAFSECYTKRMFELLLSSYSTISVADTAHFLGAKIERAWASQSLSFWHLSQIKQHSRDQTISPNHVFYERVRQINLNILGPAN